MKKFVGGLDLSPDLVKPFVRDMTVGTSSANARPVLVVNGLLQLLIGLSRISWQEMQNVSVFATSIAQLKPPQNRIPPMPPTMSNVASEKREVGVVAKVQIRAMRLLCGVGLPGLLKGLPFLARDHSSKLSFLERQSDHLTIVVRTVQEMRVVGIFKGPGDIFQNDRSCRSRCSRWRSRLAARLALLCSL